MAGQWLFLVVDECVRKRGCWLRRAAIAVRRHRLLRRQQWVPHRGGRREVCIHVSPGIYKGGVLVENTLVLHVSVACPEVLPNALGLQYR
jgi:hypothetical protein